MRDPISSLLGALERNTGGVAIVWCPDLGLRAWLVNEVESLTPTAARPLRTSSVEEAIAEPDRLALLVPDDEAATVLEVDGSRDRLRDDEHPRTQPIVLFLVRDGDGQRALAEQAAGLSSWTLGSDVDFERLSEIDVPAERARFERQTGQSPEAWLVAWRSEATERTSENYATAYWAMLLEAR
jgi:hypothetical protein